MRFSYCIFDTFRVPGGRVRLAVSAGRQRPAPPTVGRTLLVPNNFAKFGQNSICGYSSVEANIQYVKGNKQENYRRYVDVIIYCNTIIASVSFVLTGNLRCVYTMRQN